MPEPFEVHRPPAAPRLPGHVTARHDAGDTLEALASDILSQAAACVRQFGDFHLALSGGGTPLPLYRMLMTDPAYRALPWRKTHLWIVDERRVPFDDERSNYHQIHGLIVEHSDIPRSQVHPILATRDDADTNYEKTLREALEWREKGQDRLDCVVLGMGADGHTASLFPRSRALRDHSLPPRMVLINSGPEVTPPDRVTMTQHLINASRFIAILVTGASKRPTIARIAAAHAAGELATDTPDDLPILAIKPKAGELRWYLDHEACPS
ncbi:MAG TPA: 6-phosphogluconolactonase [Phycisphaerales bacterium]|nr:6-phosphogluconolactonase [Phycisphaerales bacterium]